MKKISFFVVISLLLSWGSCTKPVADSVTPPEARIIDLDSLVEDATELLLSDAVQRVDVVELSPYEDKSVGNIRVVHVTDDDIFVSHLADHRIVRYSRQGRFRNTVGTIGLDPQSYTRPIYFWLDDEAREVYVLPAEGGIKVYDYDGHFLREQTDKLSGNMFLMEFASSMPIVYHLNQFFIERHMPFVKSSGSLMKEFWSVAVVDEDFDHMKLFQNPAHRGWEEEIAEHSLSDCLDQQQNSDVLWKEVPNEYGIYGGDLTVKFADSDTIYRWTDEAKDFTPQYALRYSFPKDDFGDFHTHPYDSVFFNSLRFIGYYPSRDYIYLKAARRGDVYGYRVDRKDLHVKRVVWNYGLRQRVTGHPEWGFTMPESTFLFKNDISGGTFQLEHRSQGKYWIDVMYADAPYIHRFIDDLRTSSPASPSNAQVLQVAERAARHGNPLMFIAVLK